jgi:hypothetical protein
MPKEFNECVEKGGRVRTLSGPDEEHGLKENQYMHICYLGKESFAGEVKTKKKGKTVLTK